MQDAEAVHRLLKSGAMLHMTAIGETSRDLAVFAAGLERDLNARVQVNLHAGFAASKGFHTHWDGHDVYAIQIAGRKQWRVYGFTEEAPLAVPPEAKRGAPEDHTWEGILDTGSMLYLPRGYWHSTEYVDEMSLHLTFAVQHPTGIDFLEWILPQMRNEAAARRDFHQALFHRGQTSAKREYLSELSGLASRALSIEALDRFCGDYRALLTKLNHVDLSPGGDNEAA